MKNNILRYFTIFLLIFFSYVYSDQQKNKCEIFLGEINDYDLQIYTIENQFNTKQPLKIFCNGSIVENDQENEYIVISLSKRLYFITAQLLVPLITFLIIKKVNFIDFILIIITNTFLVHVIFNLNFGLNYFNSISINQTLFLLLLKFLVDHEN